MADQPNHSAIPKPTVAVGANVMADFLRDCFGVARLRKRSIRSADNQMMNPQLAAYLGRRRVVISINSSPLQEDSR